MTHPFATQNRVGNILRSVFLLAAIPCGAQASAADAAAAPAADPKVAQFETLAQSIMQNPAGASEEQILSLIASANELGRFYATNIAIKAWLARQTSPSAAVLRASAENASLAGDLRTSASRYKLLIAASPADEGRSRAAAKLYEILVDDLGNFDDAYAFMTRQGLELRQSPASRKFDGWYLEQAQIRRDVAGMAALLSALLAEKMPLEVERISYWNRLDWLMCELARATPNQFASLTSAKKIVGLVRESPARASRYGFIVAWLEYQAGAAGKEQAALEKAFEPVVAAAAAYAAAAPTAATLNDVIEVFICGTGNHDLWKTQAAQIHGWWTASFEKLADREKPKAMNYQGWQQQASPEQWMQLGVKFPEVFKKAVATRSLPLLVVQPDLAVYTSQATFLSGVPSAAAKTVNSLAATKGTDLLAGFRHLSQQESWHGGFDSTFNCVQSSIWPIWNSFPKQPAAATDAYNKALLAWAPEAIARTPIAIFQPTAAQAYLNAAFANGTADPADKSAFVAALRSLDWVPWDEKTRRDVIAPVHTAYKQWSDHVRKQVAGPEKAKWEKAGALIAPLEEEFKKAFDPAVSLSADIARLADPLAGHLARCVRAIRDKKLVDYTAAAREAYKIVRDYPDRKTPFGQATLVWLLSNRLDAFDTIAFQSEVIADQMAAWAPGKPETVFEAINTALFQDRPQWGMGGMPKASRDKAITFNATIGQGILAALAKGHFDHRFLAYHRATRHGSGWQEQEIGNDVLAKAIDTKVFLKSTGWLSPQSSSATTDYQFLVKNEYQGLAKQYPVESFFDDMFVEESKAHGWFDWAFTNYSRDEQQKAVNAAATRFATFSSLATGAGNPLGYDVLPVMLRAGDRQPMPSGVVMWSPADFWAWHSRVFLAAQPQRDQVAATAEAAYGKTRFDEWAMGRALIASGQAGIQKPASRADFFQKLSTYLDRGMASPNRIGPPSLAALVGFDPATLTPAELEILLSVVTTHTPQTWLPNHGFDSLAVVVTTALEAKKRPIDIARIAIQLWRIARDTRSADLMNRLAATSTAIGKAGAPDIAACIADTGTEMLGTELPEAARALLAGLRSEAILAFGGANPVPRSDPRWPIYDSQIAYTAGNLQSAWDRYGAHPAIAMQMYKELNAGYVSWLIRENTQTGNFDRARDLSQLMLAWMDANPGALDAESQAGLLVAYADIALARREYPQARALYERIAAAKELEGTLGKRTAELRVAEVDRMTRQFDRADEILQRLVRRSDKTLQAEAYFQLAMVKVDQDEVEEAGAFLENVFTRVPNHVSGRILEGKLNLLRRKYDVAAKVKLGVLGDKKFLIPGKPLEVDLEDKNLAVVGKATQIDIRAWTASGDEERFHLFPFGDSKTRFSGQIPTQLGAAVKGDHILQVVGGDTVRYSFAESFGNAQDKLAEEPAAMTVVTDADLFVSSGAILSKEDLENRALEAMIRQKLMLEGDVERQIALSSVRKDDQIKPGNSINVRVVDPDRSTSGSPDTLELRVATTSGDSLAVSLTETAPYSGVFEGVVPTGSSQATAYASDAAEGNAPNWVISEGGSTPWIGQPDGLRPKWLSIDCNDNVALGAMTVMSGVPGRKLKDLYVQTSFNGTDFRTVGQWRADGNATLQPWDGRLTVELARFAGTAKPPTTLADFEDYLRRGRLTKGSSLVSEKIKTLAVGPLDNNLAGLGGCPPKMMGVLGLDGGTGAYVGHWHGAFSLPKKIQRTFTVETKGKAKNIHYVFAIDGVVSDKQATPLTIARSLEKGVHRIDVYAFAHRGAGLAFEVLVDSKEPPLMASIPEKVFDVEAHPEIAAAYAVPLATITAGTDGSKLDIAFGKNTRARIVRLLIADYETDAPAINGITLTDAAGVKVLPTAKSFLELSKNGILEIVPGDRITLSYSDPSVITPKQAKHERFLTATFTNATISAAFVEFKENSGGVRTAEYIPMRRFKPGDTVKVFINDPDMDTTEAPDRVVFGVRAGSVDEVSLEAIETAEHSGIFLGTFFPVTEKPQRASEVTVLGDEDLKLTYVDRENTDPGIAWDRTNSVEQIGSDDPELRVYDVASRPLTKEEIAAIELKQPKSRKREECVPMSREIIAVRPDSVAAPGVSAKVLCDGPLLVEVIAPRLAQSPRSEAEIFVQTAAGREKLGREIAADEFPIDVPGTIRLTRVPGDSAGGVAPPGVSAVVVRGNRYAADALTEGRFMFLVSKELGAVPENSLADTAHRVNQGQPEPILQVRGNDTVFVGCRFTDASGQERWTIVPVELTSDATFDVMDRRYQERIAATHVGDSLHLRFNYPAMDVTDEKDSVTFQLAASGGSSLDFVLTETFGHSGIFKGTVKLGYREASDADQKGDKKADSKANPAAGHNVAPAATVNHEEVRTLPVSYGETVTLSYTPPEGEAIQQSVVVFKGGDADLVPFTKQFKEPEIAVQTQFTVAEAWFELAKRHRDLGQESLARREIAQGKKLLEEAIRDYPNTASRAQADYLLANLSFEFSKDSTNEEIARQHAMDAVVRFGDIVSSHPDSEYAPKSQFKKALVLEKLGQIDQACEEYVKLSYRYPDNELVAETIARLGQYFLAKGKEFDDASAAQTDPVEREKVTLQGREMFIIAAQVFGRLGERFPQHSLASKTRMLSAQCYLRAKDFDKARDVFETVYKDEKTDKELAAEAMYWAGDVHMQKKGLEDAYRVFKKLTWDYPESKWAKFARGRLTEEAMITVQDKELKN